MSRRVAIGGMVRNLIVVFGLIVFPLILGILVVGPGVPSGRNTRSTTRVGHKVLALLYEELGYRVVRFERGIESPPPEPAVLIALEPGPALLREDGRFARGLIALVERGSGVLVTLGPDSDHSAEIDDRDRLLGEAARRALEAARGVEARARRRAARGEDGGDGAAVGEGRVTGERGDAESGDEDDGIDRPGFGVESLDPSESWDVERLARFLDLPLGEGRLLDVTTSSAVILTGPLALRLADEKEKKHSVHQPETSNTASSDSRETGRPGALNLPSPDSRDASRPGTSNPASSDSRDASRPETLNSPSSDSRDANRLGTSNSASSDSRDTGRPGTLNPASSDPRDIGRPGTLNAERLDSRDIGRPGTLNAERLDSRDTGRPGTLNAERLDSRDTGRPATSNFASADSRDAPRLGALGLDFDDAPSLRVTRPRVFRFFSEEVPAKVLLYANGEPLLFELVIGRGKLLVLSEPRIFQNGAIGRAAHGRLAVRIAEYLAGVANHRTIYFEEFSHGGREAANIFELAVGTSAKWPLFQVAVICLVWIGLVVGRRRSVVPTEVPPRRSRHEVIDAMASLFLRSGDTRGAAARLFALSRLRIARSLGAPDKASAPGELARGIALRTGKNEDEVRACLEGAAVATHRQLVEHAERLRRLRTELDVER